MSTHEDRIDRLSLMFESARSYIAGAKIIMASDGIEDDHGIAHPTLPVITCSVFAIELQLKFLLDASELARPIGDGHDLKLLFNALPVALQEDVLAFQSSFTGRSAGETRSLISEERDTFKRWRYPYEQQQIETRPSSLFQLALALSEFIKSRYQIERSGNGWLWTDAI